LEEEEGVKLEVPATTVDEAYAVDLGERGLPAPSSTQAQRFVSIEGAFVATRRVAGAPQVSPASLPGIYRQHGVSGTAERFLYADASTGTWHGLAALPPRSRRHAALLKLLDQWLEDASGYDERTWPILKARIEESRTSSRKRFSG
jgi:hypothetical protein